MLICSLVRIIGMRRSHICKENSFFYKLSISCSGSPVAFEISNEYNLMTYFPLWLGDLVDFFVRIKVNI